MLRKVTTPPLPLPPSVPVSRLNATINSFYQTLRNDNNFTRMFPDMEGNDLTLDEWRWGYTIFRSRNWLADDSSRIFPIMELLNFGEPVPSSTL